MHVGLPSRKTFERAVKLKVASGGRGRALFTPQVPLSSAFDAVLNLRFPRLLISSIKLKALDFRAAPHRVRAMRICGARSWTEAKV